MARAVRSTSTSVQRALANNVAKNTERSILVGFVEAAAMEQSQPVLSPHLRVVKIKLTVNYSN